MSQIIGIGIDIVEVGRIEKAIEKNVDRFLGRVFTEREVRYCEGKKNKYEHFAARFAAKEAAMKALGTGWRKGVAFSGIEVIPEKSGKPNLVFHGKTRELFSAQGGTGSFVSLSHTKAFAVAQVILVK